MQEAVLTSAEYEFLKALSSPFLKNTSGDIILAALKFGMVAIGISKDKVPTDAEFLVIVNEVKHTHGQLTIEEFKLAFLKCARHDLSVKPDPFATLSIAYVSSILKSYKEWAAGVYNKVKDQPIETENDFPIYAVKSLDAHRGDIQMGYGHFLTELIKSNYIPYEWYNVLQEDGFIDCDMVLPRNCLWSATTQTMRANLALGQKYVWELFELAKQQNRKDIYVRC